MFSICLKNNIGEMLFAKKATLLEAKDYVTEKFNNDYQGRGYNHATIYNQETTFTIERTKGQKWSNWFREEDKISK